MTLADILCHSQAGVSNSAPVDCLVSSASAPGTIPGRALFADRVGVHGQLKAGRRDSHFVSPPF